MSPSLAMLAFAAFASLDCERGVGATKPDVTYAEARVVINKHCISCHSETPTVPAFPIAPNGIELDTAEQMHKHAERIKLRTVVDKTMPLLNKTGMTDEERGILAKWIEAGAKAPAGP